AHPNYIGVFIGLGLLTAFELVVAFLPWSQMTRILILLALAVWKAALVGLYYMHLRFEPTRVRWLAVAPLPLAVILVFIVTREFRW
ncbi:MAG TPA: cytochrome C oxidase subunit IV family protein, partial [Gemmatimonadales bacterium]|nr:cytochrome C oxidase subunit IV family protein [Gemmatimonadales bacterium]